MQTKIINFISGPSAGKTTLSALLFAEMKIAHYSVEYVQEYAKNLVWMEDFDTLNNQYLVSKTQAELFDKICNKVEYIITDACLLHGLYYNRHNPENVSNMDKVDEYIWRKYQSYNNINIFIERGDYPYEKAGRIQSEEESIEIDKYFLEIMDKNNIEYRKFKGGKEAIPQIMEYIKTIAEYGYLDTSNIFKK